MPDEERPRIVIQRGFKTELHLNTSRSRWRRSTRVQHAWLGIGSKEASTSEQDPSAECDRPASTNQSVAQAISDLGLFEWRRQLTYKAAWYGCRIVVADRFYPSSKRCHECGGINAGLTLSDREWACMECGVIHDRDFNASMNLEYIAVSSTEMKNACGEASSGVIARLRETGFVEAGKRQVFEHVS